MNWTDKVQQCWGDWLDKENASFALSETKNYVLAKMTLDAKGNSHAEKLRNARASDAWSMHQSAISEARNAALRAKANLEIMKMRREDELNREWTRRAQMKL